MDEKYFEISFRKASGDIRQTERFYLKAWDIYDVIYDVYHDHIHDFNFDDFIGIVKDILKLGTEEIIEATGFPKIDKYEHDGEWWDDIACGGDWMGWDLLIEEIPEEKIDMSLPSMTKDSINALSKREIMKALQPKYPFYSLVEGGSLYPIMPKIRIKLLYEALCDIAITFLGELDESDLLYYKGAKCLAALLSRNFKPSETFETLIKIEAFPSR